jgi:hypothetical protein
MTRDVAYGSRSWLLCAAVLIGTCAALTAQSVGLTPEEGWTVDGVASTGDVGFWHALASTPSGPAIAYSDLTNEALRYATLNGSSWGSELVDRGKGVGSAIDLALNSSGRPGISYVAGSLKFAERTGTSWTVQVVTKLNSPNDVTSLAFLGETPYIAFSTQGGRTGQLQVARREANKWVIETVDRAAARYKSLAFDMGGRPVVAYSDDLNNDNYIDTLKVARKTASGWQSEVVANGAQGTGVFAGLAFDPQGNPAVVHGNGSVYYVPWVGDWAARTWGGWGTPSLVDAGPYTAGESLRFVGWTPLVSLRQTLSSTGSPSALKVATGGEAQVDGSRTWTPETMATTVAPESIDYRTSLSIDPQGHPAVSVFLSRAQDLKYVHK